MAELQTVDKAAPIDYCIICKRDSPEEYVRSDEVAREISQILRFLYSGETKDIPGISDLKKKPGRFHWKCYTGYREQFAHATESAIVSDDSTTEFPLADIASVRRDDNDAALKQLISEMLQVAEKGHMVHLSDAYDRYCAIAEDKTRTISDVDSLKETILRNVSNAFDLSKNGSVFIAKQLGYANGSRMMDRLPQTGSEKLKTFAVDDKFLVLLYVAKEIRRDILRDVQSNAISDVLHTFMCLLVNGRFDEQTIDKNRSTEIDLHKSEQKDKKDLHYTEEKGENYSKQAGKNDNNQGKKQSTQKDQHHSSGQANKVKQKIEHICQGLTSIIRHEPAELNKTSSVGSSQLFAGCSVHPHSIVETTSKEAVFLNEARKRLANKSKIISSSRSKKARALKDIVNVEEKPAKSLNTRLLRKTTKTPKINSHEQASGAPAIEDYPAPKDTKQPVETDSDIPEVELQECIDKNAKGSSNELEDNVILRALLKRFQNPIKPLNINNGLSLLYESVYKNNGVMTQLIVDRIEPEYRSKNVKITTVEETQIEELLTMAIDRNCRRPVISSVNRLLLISMTDPSHEQLLARYRKILAKMNLFDQQLIYTLICLGLLQFDENVDKIQQCFPQLRQKITKFNKMGRSTDPQCFLNFLLCDSEKLEEFIDWYRQKESYSSHRSSSKVSLERVFLLERSIFEVVGGRKNEGKEESEQVKHCVDIFMKKLCEAISEENPVLKCIPKRVGSSEEGTRCFFPNEFDYFILLEQLSSSCVAKKLENEFCFTVPHSCCQIEMENFLHRTELGVTLLDVDSVKQELNSIVRSLLQNNSETYCKQNRHEASSLSPDNRLVVEPTGYFTQKVKFSTVNLVWRGEQFRYLTIQIDLVPAILTNEKLDVSQLNFEPEDRSLYVILHGSSIGCRTGYSVVENEAVKSFPPNIRRGFLYAKAFRCAAFLQSLNSLQLIDNTEDLLTSYMLKTTLLFCTSLQCNAETPIEWAIAIYEQLCKFLKEGRIPHFFENPSNLPDGECLFKIEASQKHVKERERQDMLMAAEHILELLKNEACPSHGRLAELCQQQWNEHKIVEIPEIGPIFLIKGYIYCCMYEHGINIYNRDLEKVGHIAAGEMESIRGVTQLGNDLVVAAWKGLFHLTASGEVRGTISTGWYRSVVKHGKLVFASRMDASTLARTTHIDVYEERESWIRIRSVKLPCNNAHTVTLHVTTTHIHACCMNDNTIYELSHDGRVRSTNLAKGGEWYKDSAIYSVNPWLCHSDSDGALLVVLRNNERLLVLHSYQKLSRVRLQQQVSVPNGALYTPGRLHVVSRDRQSGKYKLSLYLPHYAL